MELIRARKSALGMDMAPLIDVVFLLLVFFMLTSTFTSPAMNIVLPKAAAPAEHENVNTVIQIDRQGRVFLDAHAVDIAVLQSKLQAALAGHGKRTVHLRADADMPYKFFVRVLGIVKAAGAKQIDIVYQNEKVR